MNDPSREADDTDQRRAELQFSLRDLLVLTFVVALGLGVSMWLGPYACLVSSAILGAWLDCRIQLATGRPLLAAGIRGGILAGGVGRLVAFFSMPTWRHDPFLALMEGVILGAVIGAVFGRVYRWRRARRSPESEGRG